MMRAWTIVTPAPAKPTIEDLRVYKQQNGCSLAEACRALGWVGQRITTVPW